MMSKFKIIEPGRILTTEEMTQVEGGICVSPNIYRICREGLKTTCIGFVLCLQEFTCSPWFRTCTPDIDFTCPDDVYKGVIDDIVIVPKA